jgi:glutamine synthetase
MAMQTPKDVVKFAKDNKVEAVDLKFLDLLGIWQHFTIPTSELSEDLFEEGNGFDGSSIRGWQPINASDMLVMPDPTTAVLDPFTAIPTLSLICNITDPVTKEDYSRDPRNIARKAEAYLKSTGVGDVAYFGPEPEFFIFDEIRYEQNQHTGYYSVDSAEGQWNTGRGSDAFNDRSGNLVEGKNLGYKPRYKEGYFPVPPTDTQQDIRAEMVREMEKVGIRVEKHHHEVATAGQAEIDMRFLPLVKMGDALMWYKYIVKNVARRWGKTATFMPKPIFLDNGSGMHVHQSIWKGEKPLFAGDKYGGMSELGMAYIGGILKHAPALARSPVRRRTRTTGSCRASRPRSTSRTPAGTARPRSASRCTRRRPRRSASRSASRIRRATATWRSPRCSWPASTASSVASTPGIPSTRTSTR